jgi:hypothetical protein
MVLDNATALQDWYANNTTQYGNLWNPQLGDGQKVEVNVPRLIALPLWAAQLYHKRGGAVMPHELMADIELHLASPDTNLGNGDEWGLIKTWLQVAAQMDKEQGTQPKPKSHIAFSTDALLTNDDLIHQWFAERLDATLGRRPDIISMPGGMQANMSAMSNMTGIIAAEVGKGLGKANQSVARSNPTQASSYGSSNNSKPYTQDHVATLLGFHGAGNVSYLKNIWRMFKSTKVPNYDHHRWAIKAEMLKWADNNPCWIEEGVYFDNKTLDDWIALKFNPGNSIAL